MSINRSFSDIINSFISFIELHDQRDDIKHRIN
jgi:hypothetical protein